MNAIRFRAVQIERNRVIYLFWLFQGGLFTGMLVQILLFFIHFSGLSKTQMVAKCNAFHVFSDIIFQRLLTVMKKIEMFNLTPTSVTWKH